MISIVGNKAITVSIIREITILTGKTIKQAKTITCDIFSIQYFSRMLWKQIGRILCKWKHSLQGTEGVERLSVGETAYAKLEGDKNLKMKHLEIRLCNTEMFIQLFARTHHYLGCFQFAATVNKVAVNIHVQVFLWA